MANDFLHRTKVLYDYLEEYFLQTQYKKYDLFMNIFAYFCEEPLSNESSSETSSKAIQVTHLLP